MKNFFNWYYIYNYVKLHFYVSNMIRKKKNNNNFYFSLFSSFNNLLFEEFYLGFYFEQNCFVYKFTAYLILFMRFPRVIVWNSLNSFRIIEESF